MFEILKRKARRAVGATPLVIDGHPYSFNQQVLILQNHLKLANVGFGVPHPTFDLGESILDKWIEALVEAKDDEVAANPEEYRQRLNDSFRMPEEQVNEFVHQYHAQHGDNQNVGLRVFEGFAGYGGASFGLKRVKEQHPEWLRKAGSFLMVPDYLNFLLTGVKKQEYTNASTTQLLDAVRPGQASADQGAE